MKRILNIVVNKENIKYRLTNKTLKTAYSTLDATIKDIPRPRSLPLIGTKLDLFIAGGGSKLHEYVDSRHKQLGPIFCEQLDSNHDLVFISDAVLMKSLFLTLEGKYPAHILPDPWVFYEKIYGSKRGLFFMNGEDWLTYRRISNKLLLRDNIDSWFHDPIKTTIDQFIAKWKAEMSKGDFLPHLETEFYRLSADVVISILRGNESSMKPNRHYDMLMAMFSETVKKIFYTTTKLYGLPIHWCYRLNLKIWRDFKESVDMSLKLAQNIVKEILDKRHETTGLIMRLSKENVPDDMITRIAADFVIAAGDTTAYTTLWILYTLAKHPHVIEEMRGGHSDYVKHVVKESMRLYPVAPFLTRILPNDSSIGSYKLNKGTPIIASIYTSGRNEQYFSEAHKFLPHRWDRYDSRQKDLVNHTPSASLPFALGARSCVGKKIAMVQINEVISQIALNFDLKLLNTMEVKPVTSQVLLPDKEIILSLSPRASNN